MNENGERPPRDGHRLPPPAFPPGQRHQLRPTQRAVPREPVDGEGEVPADAFISPDEPIVRSGFRSAEGAFISPDEPLPRRPGRSSVEVDPETPDPDDFDPDEVVVTGIGDDPHLGREDLALGRIEDAALADLALRVGRLADALRDRGEAALRTTPDMTRFEATLRAYCVGYLAAQRDRGRED